jgi:hypothetical protein
MRSILLQVMVLTLAQAGASTIRTGDVARSVTAEDIASIETMVGAKPWLVDGSRPLGPPAASQTIRAYFAPTTATSTLRRGAYMTFSRDLNPGPGPWRGMGSAQPYVQVAIPGRPFDQIENDDDLNRPFTVSGSFQNEELVELVSFVRSNPGVVTGGRGQGSVGTRPITTVQRELDGSVSVGWRFDLNQGQTAILEKRGANWVVTSLRRLQILYAAAD